MLFLQIVPLFLWLQIAKFKGTERLCEDLVSLYFVFKSSLHQYFTEVFCSMYWASRNHHWLSRKKKFLMSLCLWQSKNNTKDYFLSLYCLCTFPRKKSIFFSVAKTMNANRCSLYAFCPSFHLLCYAHWLAPHLAHKQSE